MYVSKDILKLERIILFAISLPKENLKINFLNFV